MNLRKYSGCSLEVFEEDAYEIMRADLETQTVEAGVGSCVTRYICCDAPPNIPIVTKGLDHFLEEVDEYFEEITSAIGATVVKHAWGLLRNDYPDSWASLKIFGLEDYYLGARVEVLGGKVHRDNFGEVSTEKALLKKGQNFFEENGWWIKDVVYRRQYMRTPVIIDRQTIQARPKPKRTLLDIEPRIHIQL